jgi:hypothetical protein
MIDSTALFSIRLEIEFASPFLSLPPLTPSHSLSPSLCLSVCLSLSLSHTHTHSLLFNF